MFPLKDNLPTDRVAVVSIGLMVVHVAVYFGLQGGGLLGTPDDVSADDWGPIPGELTAMFMHGSSLHLLGTMLALWLFGSTIEDTLGRGRFVVFYLSGGVITLAVHGLIAPGETSPIIGATGAVAGVLGAYALLYRRARVVTLVVVVVMFSVIEIPALLMLGLWFAQQAALGATDLAGSATGIAGAASWIHLVSFFAGAALIRRFAVNVKDIPPRIARG